MVAAVVEHYIKGEYQDSFNAWLRETEAVVSKFPGFRSLRRLNVISADTRTILEIVFEKDEELRAWSSSDAHNEQLEKIAQVSDKPYYSFIYRK